MQSNAAARSALRDTVKRLKRIRKECGVDEDELRGIQKTGDPFRDACNIFTATLRECSDQVDDRNAAAKKYGQDRSVVEQTNAVMLQFRELEKHLGVIREMVSAADNELARGHLKKKSANKILLLERQFTERNNTYQQCDNLLTALKEKNARRFDNNGLTEPQQIRLGAKNAMREQLLNLKRNTAPMGSGVDEEGSTEMVGMGASRGSIAKARRLEEDPATREQMKQIAADDRKISQGLDNISKGVSRLHEIALQIGSEIDNQNRMLDATEEKVDKSHNKLTKLNDRLGAMVKKSQPMNIFINIGCCVILLGLVGFLLFQFDVV